MDFYLFCGTGNLHSLGILVQSRREAAGSGVIRHASRPSDLPNGVSSSTDGAYFVTNLFHRPWDFNLVASFTPRSVEPECRGLSTKGSTHLIRCTGFRTNRSAQESCDLSWSRIRVVVLRRAKATGFAYTASNYTGRSHSSSSGTTRAAIICTRPYGFLSKR